VFAACNAIADTSGMTLTPETVWIRLVPTVAVEGKATLLLDFSKPVSGLTNETSAADLAGIFTFKNGENTSGAEKIKPTKISKDSEAVYTLFVENVPDGGAGTVLLTITKSGIAPPTRAWSLDGEVYEISLSRSDTGAELDEGHPYSYTAVDGYAPLALGVTITNVGVATTGTLTIALSGSDKDKFSLSPGALDGIAAEGMGAFSIEPQAGLTEGSYTTSVQVSGNGIAKQFTLSFTVKQAFTLGAVVGGGADNAVFNDVAIDPDGNTYAVGYQEGRGTFTYGGFSVTGSSNFKNALIVKYDGGGNVLWAQTVHPTVDLGDQCYDDLPFLGVAADADAVYVVLEQPGSSACNYGNNITGQGSVGSWTNATIVKYDSDGTAQWVHVVGVDTTGTVLEPPNPTSLFSGAATDGSGNVYAVGYIYDDYYWTFNGITVREGNLIPGQNAVIVKFSNAGEALWAKTVHRETGATKSTFSRVAADSDGKVYAAGYQDKLSINYGPAIATGIAHEEYGSSYNAVLVQYDGSTGAALWAKTTEAGSANSYFQDVAVDGSGNIYAAGYQVSNGSFTYSGQSVSGPHSASEITSTEPGSNALLVQFDRTGTARWAKSMSTDSAAAATIFYGVAADAQGNVYAAGFQNGSGTFNYGSASPTSDYVGGFNAVVVKYNSEDGSAPAASSVTGGGNASQFNAIAGDGYGNFAAVGSQTGTGAFNYGENKTATATTSNENALVVGYR
jgi:hypothetical protein